MKIGIYIATALVALACAGCSSGDITSPTDVVFPAKNVSFKTSVYPYMSLACNTTGCHDGFTANADNFTSWTLLRSANGVVAPGDTTSELVLVMFGKVVHSGQFLANDNQRNGIRQWVLEGANDN